MATFPPSLALNLRYSATGTSNVTPFYTHCLERVDVERKLFCGQVALNVMRCPRGVLVFATSRASTELAEQLSTTTTTDADEQHKASTYVFRTEIGGLVKVSITKENTKFAVCIEVSSFQMHNLDDGLLLSWGVYRNDSSHFMPRDFRSSASNARVKPVETPFKQTSLGNFILELHFQVNHNPFYLSFSLKSPSTCSQVKNHTRANFVVPVGFSPGSPTPLGLSFSKDGSVNFAVFASTAESVHLCLYKQTSADAPDLELDLDPYFNRSGDTWHASIPNASAFSSYGFRCKGDRHNTAHILLDPYAKLVTHVGPGLALGQLCKEPPCDWTGDVRPDLPIEKLMVYRLNVTGFTKHKSSKLPCDIAGTFYGVTEKLHYLADLGINAVLLEPIFQSDEQKGPYFPCHFFSPMSIYGPSGGSVSASNSMKEMVKKLHANNIEVLLEIVFTHNRGIDDLSYNVKGDVDDEEASSCNYPIVQRRILDSLRHWVTEYHIDGFCFMDASSLLRGPPSEYLPRPPLVEAIAFDPILAKSKMVADFWDPHELIEKQTRFPHWKRWAEMNRSFCVDVRNFMKGEALVSDLATRLCGSGDIFSDGRGPAFSFNFIASNFGLPLVDLVSYNSSKMASENKPAVLETRLRQVRNFLFILYVSLGVPVLTMGDECGQSSGGSLDRKPLDWKARKSGFGLQITQFVSFLTSLRARRSDLLQKRNFLDQDSIHWHGSNQSAPRWQDPNCKFLAMTLKADAAETQGSNRASDIRSDLFVAFNAGDHAETVILPQLQEGMAWCRLVDTTLPFPRFFSTDGERFITPYQVKAHSCVLFEAISSTD